MPDHDHRRRQQQRHQGGGQHPRNDKRLNRIDAHDAQRVELVADGARAEVGAHRGGARARDDEHGDDRTDLRHRADRGAGAGEVRGAELDEQHVEGEDQQHRERDGQHQGRHDRHPRHEPGLQDELAPRERAA